MDARASGCFGSASLAVPIPVLGPITGALMGFSSSHCPVNFVEAPWWAAQKEVMVAIG